MLLMSIRNLNDSYLTSDFSAEDFNSTPKFPPFWLGLIGRLRIKSAYMFNRRRHDSSTFYLEIVLTIVVEGLLHTIDRRYQK